jgi:hypothetical protein
MNNGCFDLTNISDVSDKTHEDEYFSFIILALLSFSICNFSIKFVELLFFNFIIKNSSFFLKENLPRNYSFHLNRRIIIFFFFFLNEENFFFDLLMSFKNKNLEYPYFLYENF